MNKCPNDIEFEEQKYAIRLHDQYGNYVAEMHNIDIWKPDLEKECKMVFHHYDSNPGCVNGISDPSKAFHELCQN